MRAALGYLAALSLSALTALSCAAISHRAPARLGLRLSPASLAVAISLQQQLIVERQGRIDALDAALEVDAERIELVGLMLGQRVFTLSYDGRELQSWRHPMLPKELREEDVLENLQLTLWPAGAIQQALPAGWSIQEIDRRRTLLLNDVAVLMIDYSGEPRWLGRIAVSNPRYGYRLVILSRPAGLQ
jgi:hypothetical protein